jgi:hypothetical protein
MVVSFISDGTSLCIGELKKEGLPIWVEDFDRNTDWEVVYVQQSEIKGLIKVLQDKLYEIESDE